MLLSNIFKPKWMRFQITYSTYHNLACNITGRTNSAVAKIEKRYEEGGLICNCNGPCPVNGKCRVKNTIYKITFNCKYYNCEISYIGATGRFLKIRWREHKQSIRKLAKGGRAKYSLAQHIEKCKTCSLNINETVNSLKLEILETIKHPVKRGTDGCSLCQAEKIQLLLGFSNKKFKLCNTRSECLQHCKHRGAYSSFKPLLKKEKYLI